MATTVNGVTYETVPWLTNEQSASSTTTNNAKKVLDQDAFLKLLLTQLQYQDPTNPVEDKEFMAQMASFSSLEQMKNLNTSFSTLASTITDNLLPSIMLQQAGTLIGREVSYIVPDSESTLTGTIESVLVKNGVTYYVIDGKQVAMSNVFGIGNQSATVDQRLLLEILNRLEAMSTSSMGEDE